MIVIVVTLAFGREWGGTVIISDHWPNFSTSNFEPILQVATIGRRVARRYGIKESKKWWKLAYLAIQSDRLARNRNLESWTRSNQTKGEKFLTASLTCIFVLGSNITIFILDRLVHIKLQYQTFHRRAVVWRSSLCSWTIVIYVLYLNYEVELLSHLRWEPLLRLYLLYTHAP